MSDIPRGDIPTVMTKTNWGAIAPLTDAQIEAARPPKNDVDSWKPYAFLSEPERSSDGAIVDVATIFLTNRECPFRCVFCDLWKNTTDQRVPLGAIPKQIAFALDQLPRCHSVKLYNSGNFFDRQAIPLEDHRAIGQLVGDFDTVIVENHPSLCNDECLRFRDRLNGRLEMALGLETAHPQVLARLNKRMSPETFQRAVEFLVQEQIPVRSFILLRPPYLGESVAREWAVRSLRFAFDCGIECCTIIPTRKGNGALEQLAQIDQFSTPQLASLEAVFTAGLEMERGRVFVDLWDLDRLSTCRLCAAERKQRLLRMNLSQRVLPAVRCGVC